MCSVLGIYWWAKWHGFAVCTELRVGQKTTKTKMTAAWWLLRAICGSMRVVTRFWIWGSHGGFPRGDEWRYEDQAESAGKWRETKGQWGGVGAGTAGLSGLPWREWGYSGVRRDLRKGTGFVSPGKVSGLYPKSMECHQSIEVRESYDNNRILKTAKTYSRGFIYVNSQTH